MKAVSRDAEPLDDVWMSMVYTVARASDDERTKIGAVITSANRRHILSIGWCGLTYGVRNTPPRQEKPLKGEYMEHAERAAIYSAALRGVSLEHGRMYTQGLPCAPCARAISMSGIGHLVIHSAWNAENSDNWSYDDARSILTSARIGVTYWNSSVLKPGGWRRGYEVPL